jgi:hypothetical protein
MKVKNVHLRNFDLQDVHYFRPNKDIEIKWYQDDELKQNREGHATFIGSKQDINKQLNVLTNHIMSDRLRTVRGVLKCRIILQANPKRKAEMKEEIKEYF